MANGIPCIHCGHQQSDHDNIREALGLESDEEDNPEERTEEGDVAAVLDEIENSREVLENRSTTLLQCPGYAPEE